LTDVRRTQLLRPFASRPFSQLLAGQAFSGLGDGAFTVALVTVMIAERHSVEDLGLVLAARSAASLLTIVFGGVVADRFRRTRIMAVADAGRALLSLAAALASPHAPIVVWLVLAALVGAGTGLFQPAYQAVIPSLLNGDDLQAGNALKTLASQGSTVFGPSLGALVVTLAGSSAAFGVDAVTFVVSLATLLGIPEPTTQRPPRSNVMKEIREGARAVLERPWVAWIIASGAAQILFVLAPMTVCLPLVLHDRGDGNLYGFVLAARAVGAVAGTVFAGRLLPRRPGVWAQLGPLTLMALLLCMLLPIPSPLFVLGGLVSGLGPSLFIVLWPTALQRAIPPELRGRVFAADQLGAFTFQPVGLAVAPLIVSSLGFHALIGAAAFFLVGTTFLPLLVPGAARLADPVSSARAPAPVST